MPSSAHDTRDTRECIMRHVHIPRHRRTLVRRFSFGNRFFLFIRTYSKCSILLDFFLSSPSSSFIFTFFLAHFLFFFFYLVRVCPVTLYVLALRPRAGTDTREKPVLFIRSPPRLYGAEFKPVRGQYIRLFGQKLNSTHKTVNTRTFIDPG